ncbi:MAG: hypothetical protein KME16_28090 [Scytolyngbya sp. HA4215-MV1]|jgi:hypothetical protein|nr:hypothetical protein [Scytolyngbya sp. HA4215-MV1]
MNSDYPLSLPWERTAAKELADCLHFLTHGMFQDYDDCCDRLASAAERIRETVAFYANEAACEQPQRSQDDNEGLGEYPEAIATIEPASQVQKGQSVRLFTRKPNHPLS